MAPMNHLTFSTLFEGELPFDFDTLLAPWKALEHLDHFLSELQGYISADARISPQAELIYPKQIVIEAGAQIEASVQIEGPCFIGRGACIRHGASLRAGSLIMEGAIVGHCSEIKHSILMPKARAPHFNYVGDSILGAGVNLGAGVVLSNQRLDKQLISVRIQKMKIPTYLHKFGSCVGDRASIGSGTVCNPGAIFEKEAVCKPLQLVTGFYEGSVWSGS